MGLDIKFNDSYYRKMDTLRYQYAIEDTVDETTLETMLECEDECPVDTGFLRDNHGYEVDGMTSQITNEAYYWIYVVYGTIYQSANNYPNRAWNNMISQNRVGEIFVKKLKENGIDVE